MPSTIEGEILVRVSITLSSTNETLIVARVS